MLPPGTNPDGTYTIPSGPLKGSVVTPGAVKAKAAKADVNTTASGIAAKYGWQGSKSDGADIVGHYLRSGAVRLAWGEATPAPGRENEFNEMVQRLHANNGKGAKAAPPTPKQTPGRRNGVIKLP